MVNEAVKVELTNETGFPRRFTVASAVAIAKGTVLELLDSRNADGSPAAAAAVAGIASMDKSASDFSTSISAWTDGIFEMYASGGITVGDNVMAAGAENEVIASTGASGAAFGYALETTAGKETINIRVRR